jgi:hypothetical protein
MPKSHGTTTSRSGELVTYRRIGGIGSGWQPMYSVFLDGVKIGNVQRQEDGTRWRASRAFGPNRYLIEAWNYPTRRAAAERLLPQ